MWQLEMTPCQACPWLQMRALISPCLCREAPCTHCQPNGPQSQCDCLLTWHVRRRCPPAVHRCVWVLLLFVPPPLPSRPFSRSLKCGLALVECTAQRILCKDAEACQRSASCAFQGPHECRAWGASRRRGATQRSSSSSGARCDREGRRVLTAQSCHPARIQSPGRGRNSARFNLPRRHTRQAAGFGDCVPVRVQLPFLVGYSCSRQVAACSWSPVIVRACAQYGSDVSRIPASCWDRGSRLNADCCPPRVPFGAIPFCGRGGSSLQPLPSHWAVSSCYCDDLLCQRQRGRENSRLPPSERRGSSWWR
eukprot:COSAG01_NODE_3527_length_5971_cov_2.572377_2_plen_308_part_00